MSETKILDLSQFEKPNKDTPNVKDLWRPEVEKETEEELLFDPERDITEEDWEKIFETLNLLKRKNKISEFAYFASNATILNPNYHPELTDSEWDSIKKGINSFEQNILHESRAIKIGNFNRDFKEILSKSSYDDLKTYIWVKDFSGTGTEADLYDLFNFKIVFPKTKLVDFDKYDKTLEEKLDKIKLKFESESNYGLYFIYIITRRIYDPNFKFVLSKTIKKWLKNKILKIKMQKEIDPLSIVSRDEVFISKWRNFISYTTTMTLLSAKKIEATNQGLKITMPERKPKLSKTPPLPTKLNLN